jgi:hypothetical protein
VRSRSFASIAVATFGAALTLVAGVSVSAGTRKALSPTTIEGGSVTSVIVVRQSSEQVMPAHNDWSAVPGATADVTVQDGTTALVLVRFSSGSSCQGPSNGAAPACLVRVLVDGAEAEPVLGNRSAWAQNCGYSQLTCWAALSLDRSAGPLDPGTHTVTIQTKPGNYQSLDFKGWSLTIERVQVTP